MIKTSFGMKFEKKAMEGGGISKQNRSQLKSHWLKVEQLDQQSKVLLDYKPEYKINMDEFILM